MGVRVPSDTQRAAHLRQLKERVRRYARERDDAIREWAAAGATLREIAEAIDMSPARVYEIVTAPRDR